MKIIPHPVISTMSGKVFSLRSHTSTRTINGRVYSYTYRHPPAVRSEAQRTAASIFGIASAYARLILSLPEAKEHFSAIVAADRSLHRVDNYVATLLKTHYPLGDEFWIGARDLVRRSHSICGRTDMIEQKRAIEAEVRRTYLSLTGKS